MSISRFILVFLVLIANYANATDVYGCGDISSIKYREAEFNSYVNEYSKRNPHPLKKLHTEGTLPHEGIYDESIKAEADFDIMLVSSLSWLANINKYESLKIVRDYALAWVNVYQPSFNPIDETVFDKFLQSYSIIRESLNDSDRKKIDTFISSWAYGYIKKINEQNANDNWQSHRIKLVTLMSVTIHDKNIYNIASQLFKKQISNNIFPDGHTVDFDKRDALEYVIYDLLPLVQSALVAKGQGDNWYQWVSPSGSSLKKGVYWLNPYVLKNKNHYEFSNTTQEFDRVRNRAGLGYSGLFNPKSASDLYWSSQLLDKKLFVIAESIQGSKHSPIFAILCN